MTMFKVKKLAVGRSWTGFLFVATYTRSEVNAHATADPHGTNPQHRLSTAALELALHDGSIISAGIYIVHAENSAYAFEVEPTPPQPTLPFRIKKGPEL